METKKETPRFAGYTITSFLRVFFFALSAGIETLHRYSTLVVLSISTVYKCPARMESAWSFAKSTSSWAVSRRRFCFYWRQIRIKVECNLLNRRYDEMPPESLTDLPANRSTRHQLRLVPSYYPVNYSVQTHPKWIPKFHLKFDRIQIEFFWIKWNRLFSSSSCLCASGRLSAPGVDPERQSPARPPPPRPVLLRPAAAAAGWAWNVA